MTDAAYGAPVQHPADAAATAEATNERTAAADNSGASGAPDDSTGSRPLAGNETSVRFADGQGLHAEAQQSARGAAQAAAQNAAAATRQLAATGDDVVALGERIARGDGPLSDADHETWVNAQSRLRSEVTSLAAAVSGLPADAPERQAAQAEIARLGERLAALELPVLAKLDPEMGKSWALFNSTQRDSEGAVLSTRLKMYGMTREDLQRYVLTGEQSPGLARALSDAQRRGEWPALGVVRAAYMMRADYLRATTLPEDAQSRELAGRLDATATDLSRNRAAIHMAWGTQTAARLLRDHGDKPTLTPHVQRQLDEAKRAIASVRERAVEQINANPARHGATSATRTLAADGLTTEANIAQAEARAKMEREAKDLARTTAAQNGAQAKAGDPNAPKIAPPPAKLPADLVEGGTVDRKRDEAVKIDPRLGDVVKGGDRAVQYTRDVLGTRKLRLANDEQQLAHLQSKQRAADAVYGPKLPAQRPVALEVRVNTQLEKLYKDTLGTHDRLTGQKAGSLSVEQTKLLAELGTDARGLSGRIAGGHERKQTLEATHGLATEQKQTLQKYRDDSAKQLDKVMQQKVERLESQLAATQMSGHSRRELAKLRENPRAYAESKPSPAGEQQLIGKLKGQIADLDGELARAAHQLSQLGAERDHSRRVDGLDGVSNTAKDAVGSARQALARAEAHINNIPAQGPERAARLQAALDHQAAVAGMAVVERDTADSAIYRGQMEQATADAAQQRDPNPATQDAAIRRTASSAELARKGTETRQNSLAEVTRAANKSADLRKQLGTEVGKRAADPADVQRVRDTLAAQQARLHGVVADLAVDVDPTVAKNQLDRAGEIIREELPETHVARLDNRQAETQHARNETRAGALVALGEAAIEVANRADRQGGIARGPLSDDARVVAGNSATAAHRTLVIDGGGAAAATANQELHADLKARAETINGTLLQRSREIDAQKFVDSIERELHGDVRQFNETTAAMAKEVKNRDFGFFMNFVSEAMAGFGVYERGVNDEAHYVGMQYLTLGAGKGSADTRQLVNFAQQIRELRQAGVSDTVIMAALRDPRVASGDSAQLAQWSADFARVTGGRFGVTPPEGFAATARYVQTATPLGRMLQNARSNSADDLVAQVSHKNTDLLANAQVELRDTFARGAKDWERFKPYAAFGQVVDQVVLSVASSALLAGAFARLAAATTIPQRFEAARVIAGTLSAPAKIAMLGGINAAEAGLGMLTGAAISKVGNGIFGEGSTGAKIFNAVGGGLQLSVGSAVAMRTGIAFQAGLGLAMGSVPIVAEQLGASPALAEKLGTAVGVFVPTVLGTIANYRAVPRADGVMTHGLGVDPQQARAITESAAATLVADAGSTPLHARASQLVETQLPTLSADARARLADTLTLDAVRARTAFEPPARGTPEQYVQAIDAHYSRLEAEMVKQGVAPESARQLVAAEKITMYAEALATTNGLLAGAERNAGAADPRSVRGIGAATRQTAEQAAQHLAADPAQAAHQARLRVVEDGMAQVGGIPRDILRARDIWPTLATVESRLAVLRDIVNQRLQAQGLPPTSLIGLIDRGDNVGGKYTASQHEIAITELALNLRTLTSEQAATLSGLLRHEVEHLAQWTDMARVLAADGLNQQQIVAAMGRRTPATPQVSQQVAAWAVAEFGAGRGIDLASPRALAARTHLDTVYGEGVNAHGQTREEVYAWLEVEERNYLHARGEAQRAEGSPREAATRQQRDLALERVQEAQRAYEQLSEEHGAHVQGHLAEREARILGDTKTPGADDFENAPTGVHNVRDKTAPRAGAGEPGPRGGNAPAMADTPNGTRTPGTGADATSANRRAAADTQPGGQAPVPPNPWRPGDHQATLRTAEDGMVQLGGVVRDLMRARDVWRGLATVEARADYLQQMVNQRLQALGLPPVTVIAMRDRGNGDVGQYSPRQHEIAVHELVLGAHELTPEILAPLSRVLRHEIEHMVQSIDMARVFAARGHTEQQILAAMPGNQLQVSDTIAAWAVAEQAAGRGIDVASPRARAAENHYQSMYREALNHQGRTRDEVYSWMREARDEYAHAKRNADAAVGTSAYAGLKATQDAAEGRMQRAIRSYEELSEEHGAYVAGDLAREEARILTADDSSGGTSSGNATTGVYNVHEATTRPRAVGGTQAVDTGANTARAARPGPGSVVPGRPIAPLHRPPDDQVVKVRTASGPEEMTAGEYRKRHQLAQRWVSEQLAFSQKWRAPDGQSIDIGALQQRAAEMFGLDRNWQRINNPIVNGPL